MNFYYLLLTIISVLATAFAQQKTVDDLVKQLFKIGEDTNWATTPKSTIQQTTHKSCELDKFCVPRYTCKSDTITPNGSDIIDLNAPQECDYLKVCCNKENILTKSNVAPAPTGLHFGCGYRNSNGVGFRIAGARNNEAQFGEFPWVVAILREVPQVGVTDILVMYECGGSIIAPNVILTAAHCVSNRAPNRLFVRAGEWDTQTEDEVLPHQDRRIAQIILHEQFRNASLFNDIALVILNNPFEWAQNVRPICLPPVGANFDNALCVAAGWGKDKAGRSGNYQVILKKIELPVVPHSICESILHTTPLGNTFRLHRSFMCAGGEKNKDTCEGDGGAPLMCPITGQRGRYYQAGIVAWGIGCGTENLPGVYANVAYLREWIDQKLASNIVL